MASMATSLPSIGLLQVPAMLARKPLDEGKKNDDGGGDAQSPPDATEPAHGAGSAFASAGGATSRRGGGGGGPQKRYTDELGDHWQKQFTEKAADPSATAYTGHSSGFRDNASVAPPPMDAAPPTHAFESQLPGHRQAAAAPPPTLAAPPAAAALGEGSTSAPALFTPAAPVDSGGGSPGGGASMSRYPEGGGIHSSPQGFSFEPPPANAAPSWGAGADQGGCCGGGGGGGGGGYGGDAGGFGGGAEDNGSDPRWEHEGESEAAPTGPPVEVVKKEIAMMCKAIQARVLVDQNAQIAAGGTCLLVLILLFFLGIWLLMLMMLAVCGAVGYRVKMVTKSPQQAAPGAFTKDF